MLHYWIKMLYITFKCTIHMPQVTLKKFGYPESLIKSYQYWDLLLRPMQPTIGSMVLICREDVHQYSAISKSAAAEQALIISDVERLLKKRFDYSKMNYLMLMMVDPAVHFHIIPRYESSVDFAGRILIDNQWPNPPSLIDELNLDICDKQNLLNILKSDFNSN